MKIRGSLKIDKDITAKNTGGSTAIDGKFAIANDLGVLRWSDLVVPTVTVATNYPKDSLVLDANGDAYISVVSNASGSAIGDPNVWKPFGASGGAPVSYIQIGPYPPGTKLEEIMVACCYPNNITGFNLNGYGSTIPENTTITNPTFSWLVAGSPTNVKISDNVGKMVNIDVTGLNSYTANAVYSYGAGADVKWTITADGGIIDSDIINWVAPIVTDNTYYGLRGSTLGVPTEAEILAGTAVIIPSTNSLKVFVNEAFANENFFVAVPFSQTHIFDKYNTDPAATPSAIGAAGSFTTLENKGIVQINGDDYQVYATAYPTASGDIAFGVELSI